MSSNIDQLQRALSLMNKYPGEAVFVQNYILHLQGLTNKYQRAEGFLQLVRMGAAILPINTSLDLICKSIKSFPRVKGGVSFLLSYCSSVVTADLCNASGAKLHFEKDQLAFAVSVLSLSGYNYKVIKRIVWQDSKITCQEKTAISDTQKVCSLLCNSEGKKEMYNILRSKMNPYPAAALIVTAYKYLHPALRKKLLPEDQLKKEKMLLQENENLRETNTRLALEIEDLKKRNEVMRTKLTGYERTVIKQTTNIKLPASLQSVLS